MELATRSYPRRLVTGLSKCIEKDAPPSYKEKVDWLRFKEASKSLFAPYLYSYYKVYILYSRYYNLLAYNLKVFYYRS